MWRCRHPLDGVRAEPAGERRSLAEMAVHLQRASDAGGTDSAAQIRRRLGLPKYDEKDYN